VTSSLLRLVRASLLLSSALPLLVICVSDVEGSQGPATIGLHLTLGLALVGTVNFLIFRMSGRYERALDRIGREQTKFIDEIPERLVEAAIIGSAALSLLLELAIIRWQGTVWEFFAFYKNLGLLACFAGLGLGYALARREQMQLALVVPLLAFQMILLISLRHSLPGDSVRSLSLTPFREQWNMGLGKAVHLSQYVAVYFFLATVFLLTALTFVPVGQLCGRLLARTEQLKAYRLNLLGSLLGVVLTLALSFLWTPPVVWFQVCFTGFVVFQIFHRGKLLAAVLASFVAIVALTWPVSTGWERIYSPYQLLERGVGPQGQMVLLAAGHYYQRVFDLSPASQQSSPAVRHLGDYYEFPYRAAPRAAKVAVVGAGTGNDVAAALRSGAQRVDAIEIDPAIQMLGTYHPEHPFSDPRVRQINDDARSFLRATNAHYDLIVYGLLDSHTLLSHASSVRLDSFVYTVEGLRDARSRLSENGVVSLSFSVMSNEIGRKIYLMMEKAFDGHPPVCILAGYDGSLIFLQSKNGDLKIPANVIVNSGFKEITSTFANPNIRADVSTDDWPFFYMPQRVYPVSYLIMAVLVLALSLFLFFNFLTAQPGFNNASFFFLGAAFMLVETKGITEMGLTFGNTWQVIGIVIAGVLTMAYLANIAVEHLRIRKPAIPYVLLLISIGLGLAVARNGGFAPTLGGKLGIGIVLTCPIFFAGIVFSTLISDTSDLSGAMASNLVGAMCGGLLEYNSMYFGFQFLYWIAGGLYLAALVSSYAFKRATFGKVAASPTLASS
jgi:hypothetical protein